jgi:hypothetical protein
MSIFKENTVLEGMFGLNRGNLCFGEEMPMGGFMLMGEWRFSGSECCVSDSRENR